MIEERTDGESTTFMATYLYRIEGFATVVEVDGRMYHVRVSGTAAECEAQLRAAIDAQGGGKVGEAPQG